MIKVLLCGRCSWSFAKHPTSNSQRSQHLSLLFIGNIMILDDHFLCGVRGFVKNITTIKVWSHKPLFCIHQFNSSNDYQILHKKSETYLHELVQNHKFKFPTGLWHLVFQRIKWCPPDSKTWHYIRHPYSGN